MSEQDNSILSALMNEDNMTAYAISGCTTNISIPQVTFRLKKLIENKVVIERKDDINGSAIYSIHPSLKSNDIIKKISTHIKKIVDLIDEEQYATSDGIKCIISFILSKTDIEDNVLSEEDEKKIAEFRKEIEEYASAHDLLITDIKGWTEPKIEWMALNDRLCACVRDGSRHCPCPDGLIETTTSNRGMCKCSLFMSKKWLQLHKKKAKSFLKYAK